MKSREPQSQPDRNPSKNEAYVQHALPGQDDKPSTAFNQGGRNRSDITSEKRSETDNELRKKQAYQEELRVQMEQAKAKKEAEKLRQKREDEEFERQIQQERDKLDQRERAEMKKEGKKVDDEKPQKKINL